MVSVEREDIENSFVTILRFKNGNEAQEISVYVWEADAIETKIKNIPLNIVNQLYTKKGTTIIKDWSA